MTALYFLIVFLVGILTGILFQVLVNNPTENYTKIEWIKCTDRVPDNTRDIIAFGYEEGRPYFETGYRSLEDEDKTHWYDFSFEVLCWADFPEAPVSGR